MRFTCGHTNSSTPAKYSVVPPPAGEHSQPPVQNQETLRTHKFQLCFAICHAKTTGFSVCCVSPTHVLNCAQQILSIQLLPNISKPKRGRKSSQSVLPRSVTNTTIEHLKTSLCCGARFIVNSKSWHHPKRLLQIRYVYPCARHSFSFNFYWFYRCPQHMKKRRANT